MTTARTAAAFAATPSHSAASTRDASFAAPRAAATARVLALAFAGLMTFGMLASVNSLATSEPHAELLARINAPSHT